MWNFLEYVLIYGFKIWKNKLNHSLLRSLKKICLIISILFTLFLSYSELSALKVFYLLFLLLLWNVICTKCLILIGHKNIDKFIKKKILFNWYNIFLRNQKIKLWSFKNKSEQKWIINF